MVSSIGSGSGAFDTASIQQVRSQVAARMIKAVDTNQDGKITEDELSKALAARGNQQGPSASEIIKQLDQGNKGYITEQDLEAGLAKADQSKPAQGPPRGGPGGGEAPPPTGGSSGTSTTTSYDPADLNQDGVVTTEERMQYALSLYIPQKETPTGQQVSLYA